MILEADGSMLECSSVNEEAVCRRPARTRHQRFDQAMRMITNARPDMKRLMPTSRPSAQATLSGQLAMIIPAIIKSAMPLTTIHSHERGNVR